MGELRETMQEPPGGENHGRRFSDNPNLEGRHVPLDVARWQRNEFMRSNGWTVVHTETSHRASEGGARSHLVNQHTILHPEEYVHSAEVVALLEAELGFTVGDLHSVYSTGGRIPADRLDLRARLDARLLDLADGGANMDLFGRVTGLNGSTVDRALARARSREEA